MPLHRGAVFVVSEPMVAEELEPVGIVHGPDLCSSDLAGQSGEPVALMGKET